MEIFVTFLKEDAKEIFHLLIIICSPLFIRDAAILNYIQISCDIEEEEGIKWINSKYF